MAKKKQKNRADNIDQLKKEIDSVRKESPEHVDWELCANTVDSLQLWINELCLENHKLKQLLKYVIEKLQADNAQTKKILLDIEPRIKKFSDDSKDN